MAALLRMQLRKGATQDVEPNVVVPSRGWANHLLHILLFCLHHLPLPWLTKVGVLASAHCSCIGPCYALCPRNSRKWGRPACQPYPAASDRSSEDAPCQSNRSIPEEDGDLDPYPCLCLSRKHPGHRQGAVTRRPAAAIRLLPVQHWPAQAERCRRLPRHHAMGQRHARELPERKAAQPAQAH